jgi:hypothetical protein
MQNEQRPQLTTAEKAQSAFHLVLLAASILMAPVQLWLRKPGTMGTHYPLCWQFLVGVLLAPVLALLFGGNEAVVVSFVFTGVSVALMAKHKVSANRDVHSDFCGLSRLGTSEHAYTRWEPLLFLLVGCPLLLVPAFNPVGITMVAGGVASAFFHDMLRSRERAKARAMRDAAWEQRAAVDLYQRRYGDER